jgi:hypothetical protein
MKTLTTLLFGPFYLPVTIVRTGNCKQWTRRTSQVLNQLSRLLFAIVLSVPCALGQSTFGGIVGFVTIPGKAKSRALGTNTSSVLTRCGSFSFGFASAYSTPPPLGPNSNQCPQKDFKTPGRSIRGARRDVGRAASGTCDLIL